jgi:hypothetical protein
MAWQCIASHGIASQSSPAVVSPETAALAHSEAEHTEVYDMKAEEKKDIIEQMILSGELDYGASQPIAVFLAQFGIVKKSDLEMTGWPLSEIREQLKREGLQEVEIITYVRDYLLHRGKYLINEKGIIRVALPSENETHVANYVKRARRLLSKSVWLRSSTPTEHGVSDNIALRQLRLQDAADRMNKRH